MKKSFSALVCALLFATLTSFAQAQSCPSGTTCTPPAGNFRFQSIDIPGATSTQAAGINDLGQIAGFFRDSAKVIHGYVQDGANIQPIVFPNAHKTFPGAISNSGIVAGTYSDGVTFHGFTLVRGTFTSIDFPGATLTEIVAVNDRGDLVGVYEDPAFGLHGFTLDKNGFTTIDDPAQTFPMPSTQTFGLNDRKTVNGLFLDANLNFHGFVLSHGVFQAVSVPGAIGTAPAGVNNSDAMVGFYISPDNVQHGYIQRGNQFTTIDFPGAVGATFPEQINDEGTVIGLSFDDQGVEHSFIADQLPGDGQNGPGDNSIPAVRTAPAASCLLSASAEPIRSPQRCSSTN